MEAHAHGQTHAPATIKGQVEAPIFRDIALMAAEEKQPGRSHLRLCCHSVQSGHSYQVDAVVVAAAACRIVVKLAESLPSVPNQAPAENLVALDLGRPPSGTYVIELHVRSSGGLHKLQQALVVTIHTPRRVPGSALGVGQDAD